VSGVDYPTMGLSQCWNDLDTGALWVETYCATTAKRGAATRFTVSGLPNPAATRVLMDGSEFDQWSVSGSDAIEIRTDVAPHSFRIATGFTRESRRRPATATTTAAALAPAIVRVTAESSLLASAGQHLAARGCCSSSCC
jgi:hypothetical protein